MTKIIKNQVRKVFFTERFFGLRIVQRLMLLTGVILCDVVPALAQSSKGGAGFNSATTEISSYQEPVKNLMRAIAAVIAIVGAFNVYFKMQNGDQDVKKTIMLTIGGCVAFVAMAEALPMFFK